jgi:hypothetical protein
MDGLPAFDRTGGLWIRLTVAGVTRLGYGNAKSKEWQEPGDREKEVLGDALRNSAMRFGAALDLWHKGDLRANDDALEGDGSNFPGDRPYEREEGQPQDRRDQARGEREDGHSRGPEPEQRGPPPEERREPQQQSRQNSGGASSNQLTRERIWDRFIGEMVLQRSREELLAWSNRMRPTVEAWPPKWRQAAREELEKALAKFPKTNPPPRQGQDDDGDPRR